MLVTLLVLQTIISISMIGVILLQRNAGDGLSGLGGGGSGNSLLSGRSSANVMTRTTSILAVLFMVNCLVMGTLAARNANISYKFVPKVTETVPSPATTPTTETPQDTTPAAPLAE
jgi:preprotein translocase subunit SecG